MKNEYNVRNSKDKKKILINFLFIDIKYYLL